MQCPKGGEHDWLSKLLDRKEKRTLKAKVISFRHGRVCLKCSETEERIDKMYVHVGALAPLPTEGQWHKASLTQKDVNKILEADHKKRQEASKAEEEERKQREKTKEAIEKFREKHGDH